MSRFKRQLCVISRYIEDAGQEIHKEEALHFLWKAKQHLSLQFELTEVFLEHNLSFDIAPKLTKLLNTLARKYSADDLKMIDMNDYSTQLKPKESNEMKMKLFKSQGKF